MKTTIWLKSQPKKKIEYSDCIPKLNDNYSGFYLISFEIGLTIKVHATYDIDTVSRVEFRPS